MREFAAANESTLRSRMLTATRADLPMLGPSGLPCDQSDRKLAAAAGSGAGRSTIGTSRATRRGTVDESTSLPQEHSAHVLLKLLGPRFRRLLFERCRAAHSSISPNRSCRRRNGCGSPRLAGLCGSDLATICAGESYRAGHVMPFVMGHELVGTVTEVARRSAGSVRRRPSGVAPRLGCRCADRAEVRRCGEGRDALCRNVTAGSHLRRASRRLLPRHRRWVRRNLVAHESQIYKVPDEMDDAPRC